MVRRDRNGRLRSIPPGSTHCGKQHRHTVADEAEKCVPRRELLIRLGRGIHLVRVEHWKRRLRNVLSSPIVAGVQGTIVVDNAFDGAGRTIDCRTLPRVTFTPAIASVGMTEAETQPVGLDCDCRSITHRNCGMESSPHAFITWPRGSPVRPSAVRMAARSASVTGRASGVLPCWLHAAAASRHSVAAAWSACMELFCGK